MYYRIIDNVLNFIFFDSRSFGFECGIYILPLYIRNEALVLDFGDQVWRIDNKNSKNYYLFLEMNEVRIIENIESHSLFFKKIAFDWFDKIGSPKGISQYILSNKKESKIMFTPDKWRYEAKAYSELYLKNYNVAQMYFEKFISDLTKDNSGEWNDVTIENINSLMTLINTDPYKANEMLLKTIKDMRKMLQLDA